MDVSCRAQEQLEHRPISQIFNKLTQVTATGHCMKCHTLDTDANGGMEINWYALQHKMDEKKFTKFSHQPHITFLDEDKCDKCHKTDELSETNGTESIFRPEFFDANWNLNRDSSSVRTSGLYLDQSTCAECHTKQKSGDNCLQCHNYHVGDFARMK